MSNELITYARTDKPVPRAERPAAAQAKQVYDETRVAALRADASMAFAARVMEGLVDLDDYRKSLTQGDPVLHLILGEIEGTCVQQVKRIQRSLGSGWEF